MELKTPTRIPAGVPLAIGLSPLPPKKDNRWNKELRRTIEKALNFSKLDWFSLGTDVDPNTDTLAHVRTLSWHFFAHGLNKPYLGCHMRQIGPITFLPVLALIQRELASAKASRLIRFRFWLYRQWAWITTEVQ